MTQTCSVCKEALQDGFGWSCGHQTHLLCAARIFARHDDPTCPQCRLPAPVNDRSRLHDVLTLSVGTTIAAYSENSLTSAACGAIGASPAPLSCLAICCPRITRNNGEFRTDWEDRRKRWAPRYINGEAVGVWECGGCGKIVDMTILCLSALLEERTCPTHGTCSLLFCRTTNRFYWVCLSPQALDENDTPLYLQTCVYEQVTIPSFLADEFGEAAIRQKLANLDVGIIQSIDLQPAAGTSSSSNLPWQTTSSSNQPLLQSALSSQHSPLDHGMVIDVTGTDDLDADENRSRKRSRKAALGDGDVESEAVADSRRVCSSRREPNANPR